MSFQEAIKYLWEKQGLMLKARSKSWVDKNSSIYLVNGYEMHRTSDAKLYIPNVFDIVHAEWEIVE